MNEEKAVTLLQAIQTKNDQMLDECLQDVDGMDVMLSNLQQSHFETLFMRLCRKQETVTVKQWLVSMIKQHPQKFLNSNKMQSQVKQFYQKTDQNDIDNLSRLSNELIGKIDFIV